MDDILIRGGQVIDGTGAPGRAADVAIRAGRIAAIEANRAESANRVIDGHGCVVAPGFIDIHTHSDFTLPLNRKAECNFTASSGQIVRSAGWKPAEQGLR
jgi:N-acyl-D-amino-acid deacylase